MLKRACSAFLYTMALVLALGNWADAVPQRFEPKPKLLPPAKSAVPAAPVAVAPAAPPAPVDAVQVPPPLIPASQPLRPAPVAAAQPPAVPQPVAQPAATPPVQPAAVAEVPVTTEGKWCDIFISVENNRDAVCVNQDGKYMPEVRQINIWMQPPTRQPVARVALWRGIYRPSNPAEIREEDWNVRRIRAVRADYFQKIIDQEKVPEDAAL